MTDKKTERTYISILEEELMLATGCTEPIAIAFCAAKVREVLGAVPERIRAEVSGNIIKNAKSVVVPNTGNLKGIGASIAAGVTAGDAGKKLQVISEIGPEKHAQIRAYRETTPIEISCMDTPLPLDIRITGCKGDEYATVRIANNHTNIVFIEKNGEILRSEPVGENAEDKLTDKSALNIKDIVEFADTVELDKVRELVERQAACNWAIAEEGMKNHWGAGIGGMLRASGGDMKTMARAYAAAGSDARMSGCEMPVVIVSGSGNQGITASVPVIYCAKEMKLPEEKMVRAILLSDLITIHQKTGIGRLSAYCGSVSAGCGAGAGIAYLHGADYETIARTVNNAVVILSGMICDGAKASCAAKIACSVEAGFMGYEMARLGRGFPDGDGIAAGDAEKTIANVGRLASEGMRQTDKTILAIMTE